MTTSAPAQPSEPSWPPPPTCIPVVRGPVTISDTDAVDAIYHALNQPSEWSPGSLDAVARIVEDTGRLIADPSDIADIEVRLTDDARGWPIAHVTVDDLLTAYIVQANDGQVVVELHSQDTDRKARILLNGMLLSGHTLASANAPPDVSADADSDRTLSSTRSPGHEGTMTTKAITTPALTSAHTRVEYQVQLTVDAAPPLARRDRYYSSIKPTTLLLTYTASSHSGSWTIEWKVTGEILHKDSRPTGLTASQPSGLFPAKEWPSWITQAAIQHQPPAPIARSDAAAEANHLLLLPRSVADTISLGLRTVASGYRERSGPDCQCNDGICAAHLAGQAKAEA